MQGKSAAPPKAVVAKRDALLATLQGKQDNLKQVLAQLIARPFETASSYVLLSSLELGDTKVYER